MTYVNTDFVKEHKEALIIDCRFNMAVPDEGSKAYKDGHIKGAIYVDLDKDMMGELGEHGGRHPLPDMDKFRTQMEDIGISDDTMVIIYDNAIFPSSARLWFMLKYLGKEAYVVDGGYPALIKAGFEWDKEVPVPKKGKLTSPKNDDLIVNIDYILKLNEKPKTVLVDSRANPRYLGLEEPIDKIAGRIPGAINIFWKDCFNDGFIKSNEDLAKMFAELDKYDEVIFYCGSGVTGAVNMLVYDNLGKKSKLYTGSYSDYISYKGNEIIIKDNKSYIIE